jgi:hypothetical protein
MAKKQAAPTLSAEHKALAAQLGFPDLSQVDWSKVLQVLQFIIALLQSQPHQMTATAKAGCETHCEGCLTAAGLALQSAETSLDCAQGMCDTEAA